MLKSNSSSVAFVKEMSFLKELLCHNPYNNFLCQECPKPPTDSEDTPVAPAPRPGGYQIRLVHFSGGIIIFMIGILVSSLVAILEYAYRNQKNKVSFLLK